jgi:hypothetical protein
MWSLLVVSAFSSCSGSCSIVHSYSRNYRLLFLFVLIYGICLISQHATLHESIIPTTHVEADYLKGFLSLLHVPFTTIDCKPMQEVRIAVCSMHDRPDQEGSSDLSKPRYRKFVRNLGRAVTVIADVSADMLNRQSHILYQSQRDGVIHVSECMKFFICETSCRHPLDCIHEERVKISALERALCSYDSTYCSGFPSSVWRCVSHDVYLPD